MTDAAHDVTSSPEPSRSLIGLIGRSMAVALATAAVAVLCLVGLNALAVSLDDEPLRRALAESLDRETGAISDSPEAFNDCLIPVMTLLDDGRFVERIVTAQRVYRLERPHQPCRALEQVIKRGDIDREEYVAVFYHQYWVGHRLLMKTLVPTFGVSGVRSVFWWSTFGLLAGGLVWSVRRVAIVGLRSPEVFSPLAQALLIASFLLFHDLWNRAASFTSAPSNLLIFAVLLVGPLVPLRAWSTSRGAVVLATLGALVAYFDLLFGAVLIGFVCLLASISLSPASGRQQPLALWYQQPRLRALLAGSSAYVVGFLATMLLHVVVADLVFEQNVLAFFWDQLSFRLQGGQRTTLPEEINVMFDHEPTISRMVSRLGERLGVIGFGSVTVGGSLLVLSGIAHVFAATWIWRRRSDRDFEWFRLLGLLLSSLAIVAWYVIFLEHTLVHARLMVRLLSWNIGIAAVLTSALVLARAPKRGTRESGVR